MIPILLTADNHSGVFLKCSSISFLQALGKGGARFTGMVYVFIHYSLLVAYMAQGGGLLSEAFNGLLAAGWVMNALAT